MLVPDTTSPLEVGLAKVRWSEGHRFGVEFIRMPGGDQIRLGRLVKTKAHFESFPSFRRWRGVQCSSGGRPS